MTRPLAGPLGRRRLLLGAGAGVGAGLVVPALPVTTSAAAPAAAPTDAEVWGVPTTDPLVEQRADPFVTPRTAGQYYLTGSVPEYDRLVVRGAPTLAGLATAEESVVWRRPTTGRMGGNIWAPELHRIDGRWYLYFAAGDADDVFRIRMYVMESRNPDPRVAASWRAPRQIVTPWDSFALDATTFAHRGSRYLVWAQQEPELPGVNSSLYIARMRDPYRLATYPARIATPTRDWETRGFKVNEGAAVLVRNGRVFCTFSASATDDRYCLGLLTADEDADLLDPRSWRKTPDPVLVTSEATSRYGPGHNSFTVAEDGVTDVLVFHARAYREIEGDPLYDPNRHARVQKLEWHPDGTPLFGVPVGEGGPIVRLAPRDRPRARVLHTADGRVRVATSLRQLERTQWRLDPGLAGGTATVSLRSVDRPTAYVRVVDSVAVLEDRPTDGDAAWATSATFRRVERSRGAVALQLTDGSDRWLAHRDGALRTVATVGRASTFDRD